MLQANVPKHVFFVNEKNVPHVRDDCLRLQQNKQRNGRTGCVAPRQRDAPARVCVTLRAQTTHFFHPTNQWVMANAMDREMLRMMWKSSCALELLNLVLV